jgi:hypothetical protein
MSAKRFSRVKWLFLDFGSRANHIRRVHGVSGLSLRLV